MQLAAKIAAAVPQELFKKCKDKLEARWKLAKTWREKRHNVVRALSRATLSRNSAQEHARQTSAAGRAEIVAAQADNAALHAELGMSFKVAAQRQHDGPKATFNAQTILRDLEVRCRSLNAGAENLGRNTLTAATWDSSRAAAAQCFAGRSASTSSASC
mmetsp:Transcript_4870/g.14343  ORF Transcript_4870/g.14343 Transcript_4870/m.14343 type:complete len:159 (+) Transcript_4870:1714-2190(+)